MSLSLQKNEGAQQYTLSDSADGRCVVLEVAVGRYLDTAEIKVDVQPTLVRCLVRGRLLQLHTPEEVCPDSSSSQRSKTTGALVVTMPKLAKVLAPPRSVAAPLPQPRTGGAVSTLRISGDAAAEEAALVAASTLERAKLTAVYGDDDGDTPPPILS